MIKRLLMFRIAFSFIFFLLFVWFAIENVSTTGWDFFSLLYAGFATLNFVRFVRLIQVYMKFKNNQKK